MKTLKEIILSTLVAVSINTGCVMPFRENSPQPKSPELVQETITKSTTHPEHGRIDFIQYQSTGLTLVYVSTPGTPDHKQIYCDFEGDGILDSVSYAEQKIIDGYIIEAKSEIERTYCSEYCPTVLIQIDKEYKEILEIIKEE